MRSETIYTGKKHGRDFPRKLGDILKEKTTRKRSDV